MDEILTAAEELGKKIVEDSRTRQFLACARAASEDPGAQHLLRNYQAHATKLQELEQAGKPIEPEDKRKLTDLENLLATNEKIKAMSKAQVDYYDLMRHVQEAIEKPMRQEQ